LYVSGYGSSWPYPVIFKNVFIFMKKICDNTCNRGQ